MIQNTYSNNIQPLLGCSLSHTFPRIAYGAIHIQSRWDYKTAPKNRMYKSQRLSRIFNQTLCYHNGFKFGFKTIVYNYKNRSESTVCIKW
ncbi:MAG: hypothetical protein HXX16_19115 [Bacteroidales bacterium]|nr:hypothetical protein [Bacteroidales bacterium]